MVALTQPDTWIPQKGELVVTAWGYGGPFVETRNTHRADMGIKINGILHWYTLSELRPALNAANGSKIVKTADLGIPLAKTPDTALETPHSALAGDLRANTEPQFGQVAVARQPLAATFTPLPPANRTLPAPKIAAGVHFGVEALSIAPAANLLQLTYADAQRELSKRHIAGYLPLGYRFYGFGSLSLAMRFCERHGGGAVLFSFIGKGSDAGLRLVGVPLAVESEVAA